MNSIWNGYPCPAQGHLDMTIKNPHGYYGGVWKLSNSKQKSSNVRTHSFEKITDGEIGTARPMPFSINVTLRGINSRWYK